jgi:hypothetical protein
MRTKCDENCAECKLPISKCTGGSEKSPYAKYNTVASGRGKPSPAKVYRTYGQRRTSQRGAGRV